MPEDRARITYMLCEGMSIRAVTLLNIPFLPRNPHRSPAWRPSFGEHRRRICFEGDGSYVLAMISTL